MLIWKVKSGSINSSYTADKKNPVLHHGINSRCCTEATVPAKYVTYICSEMAATDTFVVHYTDAFSKKFYCKLFRHAGDINIMIIVNL